MLLALPAAASAADGGISGKVTLAAGGAPVLGAEVCAEEQIAPFEFECTLSAADGTYAIAGLPPAGYIVEFSAGNSGLNITRQFWNGVSQFSKATEVTVASGLITPGINAAMLAGGAIAGRVTSASTGGPIEAVEVCSWHEINETFDGCDFTAADGTYEILGASPGLHELEFWAFESGYETQLLHGVLVSLGVRTANVNVALLGGPVVPPPPPPPPSNSGLSTPASSAPAPAPVAAPPKPKPLTCKKGFVKKRVKGKTRCVKRHKPRHHKKHQRNH